MRILVVSSYPPRHCGIGSYTRGHVEQLRREGHHVTVLSPPDGDGDERSYFFSGRPFFRAARTGAEFERIIVHFQPALYYRPRAPFAKVLASLGLAWLCLRRRQTEVLVHEADSPNLWRPDYLLLALAFRLAPVLLFHTAAERDALERAYRVRVRARLVRHTDGILVAGPTGRADARRRLGILDGETLFVCPGFLHPDKGFERAVMAFRDSGGGRLVVLGSVRDESPEKRAYAGRLRALVETTPGAELLERFVDAEEFDAWIAAADAVVLPYRRSWSSGALARAQVIGTPAIVSDVGGLAEQAGDRDVVIRTDEELRKTLTAMARPVPEVRA
ncbi:MAG: glycosyltransferase [Actinomycetota bacterium]